MALGDNTSIRLVLSSEDLLLQTVDFSDFMYYEHSGTDRQVPTNLVVERQKSNLYFIWPRAPPSRRGLNRYYEGDGTFMD